MIIYFYNCLVIFVKKRSQMNALRQFITPVNGILTIPVPVEYQKRNLEVIIMPVKDDTKKNAIKLANAHRIIDEGGGIENTDDFLAEFEASRQDRPLPFRD
jgi:hypothetical protein